MKNTLFALFVGLLMVGCGDDAVEKLERRVDELEDELEQVKSDPKKKVVQEEAKDDSSVLTSDSVEGNKRSRVDLDDPYWQDIVAKAIEVKKARRTGGDETGWFKKTYLNGQIESLLYIKNGDRGGIYTEWYENGQKRFEHNYKEGRKKDGLFINYNEDGTESSRETYKNGESAIIESRKHPWLTP